MSHRSLKWCRLLSICLFCAVVESVSEDRQAELSHRGTLHWTTRAARRVELSVPSAFSAVCLAPASLLSSSSSDRRLLSLSSRDSLSSVESSAVLSLLSSASAGPSLVSASGERTRPLGSRASPRSRVMFPSSRRRWTMLWGCYRGRHKRNWCQIDILQISCAHVSIIVQAKWTNSWWFEVLRCEVCCFSWPQIVISWISLDV